MIAIAIICIVVAAIVIYAMITLITVSSVAETVELALIAALAIFIAVYCVRHKNDINVETIQCSEIQQIDTVYKDNAVVGYEILIVR